jgi:hypothetical protein
MSWTPPYPTNEMLKLSDAGWSASQIGVHFKVTRNAVIGRIARARERLAKEQTPPPSLRDDGRSASKPAALRGEESAAVAMGLVAGNSKDRGAHLDSLMWKRRSYLSQLREEGGV